MFLSLGEDEENEQELQQIQSCRSFVSFTITHYYNRFDSKQRTNRRFFVIFTITYWHKIGAAMFEGEDNGCEDIDCH
ncbi:hypothetical protein L1987_86012 [Smallanthus sonchifolius]|uniref:Uncharacterized protein n=1 Tax=Smallanthus sonchifolius TaxID=185202 RepID=A0ACB8XZD2_9ASTR|nr:hypothetical protein L1987_86012 [Smallanthus sonchifolius]